MVGLVFVIRIRCGLVSSGKKIKEKISPCEMMLSHRNDGTILLTREMSLLAIMVG